MRTLSVRGFYILIPITLVAGIFVAFGSAYYVLPSLFAVSYANPSGSLTSSSTRASVDVVASSTLPTQKAFSSRSSDSATYAQGSSGHVAEPAVVKGVYMSQCVVGTPSFRDSLVKLVDETELNAIVIDIRDYTGKIAFTTDNPLLKDMVSTSCGAHDMREFIASLHEKNIYVIGRITTFQNPYYTKLHPDQAVQSKKGGVWKDYKGLAFVDVGAKPYWDSVVELGRESYSIGFDELNFDYIRYPSDGNMADADYTWAKGKSKSQALEEFYQYLTTNLKPLGAVLSVDLFGMTATNEDDLGIGQVLERAMPYFDHIYPMVYPSHYPKGFNGYTDVNAHTYDIVHLAMTTAVHRAQATETTVPTLAFELVTESSTASDLSLGSSTIKVTGKKVYSKPSYSANKIVPWLQSFNYPVTYTPAMVAAQIKATRDAGVESYIFWDAGNKYEALRKVLAE